MSRQTRRSFIRATLASAAVVTLYSDRPASAQEPAPSPRLIFHADCVLTLVDHVRHYGWATCHLATYVYREVKAGEVCRVEILEDFDTTADVKFEDDTVAVGLTLRPELVELERVR